MLQDQSFTCPSCLTDGIPGGLERCPHCGAWMDGRTSPWARRAVWALVILLVWLVLPAFGSWVDPLARPWEW